MLPSDEQDCYAGDAYKMINERHSSLSATEDDLFFKLSCLNSKLQNEKAREYLMQGAGRRVKIIIRCIDNVFNIFPLNSTALLSSEKLSDLSINLHAFFTNISGCMDNLAWVHVYENDLYGDPKDGKLGRSDVVLFGKKIKKHLGHNCSVLVGSDTFKTWHQEYSKNYRDALAHRIPLYVPPYVVPERFRKKWTEYENQLSDFSLVHMHDEIREKQKQFGKVSPAFAHSFDEGRRPIMIHAQIVTDLTTIKEIIDAFCKDYAD